MKQITIVKIYSKTDKQMKQIDKLKYKQIDEQIKKERMVKGNKRNKMNE